ncbi:restriction endonuclease subunit S [bacterium]|nr:restriction endonuclease subunit S [bacterium]
MSKWSKKKIKDFAFTASGGTPSTERKEYWHNGTIPWINSGELSKHDIIKKPTTYITQEALDNSSAKLFPIGTVVIALTGATTGMSAILEIETSTNQSITGIFPSKEHDSKFLLYTLHHNIDKILLHNVGSAQPHINKEIVDNLEFNYPIVPEQYVISKILSTADAVIEKTQAAIAKYKAIKQGMLQDLFTRGIDLNTNKLRPRFEDAPELYKESKLGMIPREWDEKIFGEEVDLIHGHQFRDYDFTEFGIPVVKIGQVKPDNVDLSSCSFVAYGREDEFQNEIIRNGDVLMALTGATLGKACLVKGLNGIVLQNYRVGRFEPIIKQNDIDKEFLYYLLIAGELLTQIFNKVNTGAQGNIGKADFEKATFKKPPFDEQQKIAERLKAIDNKLQTEQTYLQKIQSLKKGLMEDLLSGRKQVKVAEEVLTLSEN